mgnify:CR=1 FL=1
MHYQQLTQQEMDTTIAENLHGREVEHFHHELNIAVYDELLTTLPAGEWRSRVQQLRNEGQVEIDKIAGLHASLLTCIPQKDQEAAFARASKRRKIHEALQLQAPSATAIDHTVLD